MATLRPLLILLLQKAGIAGPNGRTSQGPTAEGHTLGYASKLSTTCAYEHKGTSNGTITSNEHEDTKSMHFVTMHQSVNEAEEGDDLV